MKLGYRDIEPFIKNPKPEARAILIYGPDDGMVRERTKLIAKTLVEDLEDPFNVCQISGETLEEEAGRLTDEAHAMSMMGGARVVIIYAASNKNTAAFKSYLEDPSETNLVIVQGDNLGPTSSLRMLFEKSKNAAALPCYVAEGQNLTQMIAQKLREQGLNIEPDALYYLGENLVGDHVVLNQEIEKLITYMGEEKTITLEHARNNTGAFSEQKLDELVYACVGGQTEKAEHLLEGLLNEGTSAIYVLRALQSHFRKLLTVQLLCQEQGMSRDQAIGSLQPKLFFKLEPAFKKQLSKWPSEKILPVIRKINELEVTLKKSETSQDLLLLRSIFGLSRIAA